MNQPARRSLAAGLLALLRPPNVFTAVADSAAGLLLARQGGALARDPGLWCLAASACLYLGGIALNDYFDRDVDARERPERPIPAGAVPPAPRSRPCSRSRSCSTTPSRRGPKRDSST